MALHLVIAILLSDVVYICMSFRPPFAGRVGRSSFALFEYDPWSPLKKLFEGGNSKSSSSTPKSNSIPAGRVIATEAVVVGAGISGCTAAYYLLKSGVEVLLTESRDELGGNLISKKADGFLWEEGPNSFQPTPTILRLAKDIDMIDDLVVSNPSLSRLVYWEGNLCALPGKWGDLARFSLLSWPGKVRAGLGLLGFIAPKPDQEETVAEFATRHLGSEAFERVIDPFVSVVYSGDSKKLSMKAALKKYKALEDIGATNGLLDGAIVTVQQLNAEREMNADRDADLPSVPGGSVCSFKDGLQSMPLQMEKLLGPDKVKKNHKLVNVQQDRNQWITTFMVGSKIVRYRSKALILTSPAYVTAPILKEVVPKAMQLDSIYYPPIASVTLAYPNEHLLEPDRQGFGTFIPRSQKIRTLGTFWLTSLFPGRTPEGYSMFLNFIGGAEDPDITNLSAEEIVAEVHKDVQRTLLKPDAPLPEVLGVKLWPRAIPQYNKGHLEMLAEVENEVQKFPGLYLGGNYKTGIALGDCVQFGVEVAGEVETYLSVTDVAENIASSDDIVVPTRTVEKISSIS